MICPNCRNTINDRDVFCSYCGASLSQQQNNPAPMQTGSFPAQNNTYSPPPQNYGNYQNNGYQPQKAAAQAKETNPVIIFIITMMVGLMLMTAFLLFIKPGYLVHKEDKDASSTSAKNDEGKKSEDKKTTEKKTEKTDKKTKKTKKTKTEKPSDESAETAESEAETTRKGSEDSSEEETVTKKTEETTKKPDETTKKPETTKAPETTKPPETTAPPATTKSAEQQQVDADNEAYSEAMSYDTSARPSFDEFEWCYGQYGLTYIPPDNADMITNPLGFCGSWKAMIVYNPTNTSGSFQRELDNVIIGVNGDAVDLTIDWYYFEEPFSESYDMSDSPDTLFLGNAYDGSVVVSSTDYGVTIALTYFWKADGKEYALGTIATPDGIPAYIAMVRP